MRKQLGVAPTNSPDATTKTYVDGKIGPSVYSATIGDGSTTAITVTHNLGTRSCDVVLYDASTFKRVWADLVYTSTNSVTLTFQTAPASSSIVVVVQGGILTSATTSSTNITDSTSIGRSLLTATNAASALALLTPMQSPQQAYVATNEATSSATYADLTTTTDTVTVTVGASGIVLLTLAAWLTSNSASASNATVSFAMSGANTTYSGVTPPDDSLALGGRATGTSGQFIVDGSVVIPLIGLTAGSTTFKMKYKSSGANSVQFQYRRITAIPL